MNLDIQIKTNWVNKKRRVKHLYQYFIFQDESIRQQGSLSKNNIFTFEKKSTGISDE